jgi:DNA-binding NarL/FixJ family response regulator
MNQTLQGDIQRPLEYREMMSRVRRKLIIIIEAQTLIRECLARCFQEFYNGFSVVSFPTISHCLDTETDHSQPAFVLYGVNNSRASDPAIEQGLSQLKQAFLGVPIILMSGRADADCVMDALDHGARGYLSTDTSLEVAVGATNVVTAGGTFVPASSLSALTQVTTPPPRGERFTRRQLEVLSRLRLGKPNRIIARELGMSESTVKAHVRNLMQKLKATNRTQVVFLTKQIRPEAFT